MTNLKKLREPFKSNQIGKLPKPTRQQTDAVKNDFKQGIRCSECGGWHHSKVIHLDYVGHAALTDRFLDVDELWNWKPLAVDEFGLPKLDNDGLLWIELTICGLTRIGVGDAGNKTGGDAMKERIGDALRNAGMRFGAALDLWHKGDLHIEDKTAANDELLSKMIAYINESDHSSLIEMWHEMDRNEQSSIWELLNTKEKEVARKLLDTK